MSLTSSRAGLRAAISALCAVVLLVAAAHASDDGSRRAPLDPSYVAECGTCHVAYPPRLLPAAAWRALMGRLDRHFGTDAHVEPAIHAKLLAYLDASSSTRNGTTVADLPRITDTEWFKHKHRKTPDAAWTKSAVKSRANCGACHIRAEAGSYRKREIKLPQ